MSAQLASPNSFSAHLALAAGVSVSISAPTLADLSGVVARLQGSANDAPKADAKNGKPAAPTAAAAAPTPPAPPSAPAVSAAPAVTYDAVKARVLALSKVSRDTAVAALKHFGVDHGSKLPEADYAAFIAHTDKLVKSNA